MPIVFIHSISLLFMSNSKIKGDRPAGRLEKLPPVLFSSFCNVSLFFLGPLVRGAPHPQGYQAEPLSILQQRKKSITLKHKLTDQGTLF